MKFLKNLHRIKDMIAILIDKLTNPEQEKYFSQFTDIIYSTNKDFKFFDSKLLKNEKEFELFLKQKKLTGLLKVEANEKIKLLDLDSFTEKTNFVCISDNVWVQKKLRFFSPFVTNKKTICQSIIIQTETNSFTHPLIDEKFDDLISIYQKKQYKKFVTECEKWIFHNSKQNQKQIMLRYYCGLVYNFKLNDLRKSLEHLGIAIILAPFLPELWCAWADILLDRKYYDKCEEIYSCACKIKTDRDIFDLYPMWIDRNDSYAEKMLKNVQDTLKSIKIFQSNIDQNNDSNSLTITVT